jgi:MraZ protein
MNLFGVYEQKIDNKGRVLLPASLKKQLSSTLAEGFVIKRSIFETCLELFPMAEWQKEMGMVNKLNRYVRKNEDFIRLFMAGVKIVELDDAGRLLIPKDLLVFSKLEKEIVLACGLSKVEIWNKELYDLFLINKADDFGDLAEDVMGSQNIGE